MFEVTFSGHVQLLKDVAMDPSQVFFVSSEIPLKLVMVVRSFLEMVGYYLHLLENSLYAHQAND
jgi:hypothetical protein